MATESDNNKNTDTKDEALDEVLDERSDDGDADDGDADDDDAPAGGDADDGDADDGDADDDDADDDDADDDDAAAGGDAAGAALAAGAGAHGRRRTRRRRRKKAGSPTRNVVLFALLVGGFVLAFAFLGNRGGGGPTPVPKWKVGQTVDVEITLVSTDYKNLGCAMAAEVAGKHCAFETQNKKLAGKSDNSRENANLLQPYTTVDGKQLMAAGLWIQPALKAKLDKENWDNPSPRFTVKCKFKVEGKAKEASIRWKPGIGWNSGNGWWVGTVSNCKLGG